MQIGSESSWAKVVVPGRPDFIGIRSTEQGYEFLTHNEGLPYPYYLTSTGESHGWVFEWDRERHAYVEV